MTEIGFFPNIFHYKDWLKMHKLFFYFSSKILWSYYFVVSVRYNCQIVRRCIISQWALRDRGSRVKNACWVRMKELLDSFLTLFTECKNSIPSSRYLRLSMGRYDGNRTFPWIFLYKNNAQNESKSWIFSTKMAFKNVWWCFLMYLHILYHKKPQNLANFQDFENISPK